VQPVEDPHVHELRVLTINPGHLKEFVQVSEKALAHKTKEGALPHYTTTNAQRS
jgi:hypothetical protein